MVVCCWKPDRWLPRDRRRNPPPDDCSGCAMFGGASCQKYLCLEFPRAWILEEVAWMYGCMDVFGGQKPGDHRLKYPSGWKDVKREGPGTCEVVTGIHPLSPSRSFLSRRGSCRGSAGLVKGSFLSWLAVITLGSSWPPRPPADEKTVLINLWGYIGHFVGSHFRG